MFPLRFFNNTSAAPIFANALGIKDWKYCNLKLLEISVFRGRLLKSLCNYVPSTDEFLVFTNCISPSQINMQSLIKRV